MCNYEVAWNQQEKLPEIFKDVDCFVMKISISDRHMACYWNVIVIPQ